MLRNRRTLLVALALAATIVAAATSLGARSASAHPLGNFTINHYDRVDVSSSGIEIFSVLDLAEIPTFKERQAMDTNDDGNVDDAEASTYVEAKAADLREGLRLRVDGDDVALETNSRSLTFADGQGGLKTLRLESTYRATPSDDWNDDSPSIQFEDSNDSGRIGWREIVVRAGPGVELRDASVPSQDVSAALTAYPTDLSSPLDVRSATFSVAAGAGAPFAPAPGAKQQRATRGNPDPALAQFADLIAKDEVSAGVIVVALLAAVGFGALHALSPGHGKTIVAAYLIGSRGTARHALLLGLTVTATHTSSVYAMGFVALYLSQYVVPEDLYPWLGVGSGALILAMGASLLVARLRASGLLADATSWLRRVFSPPRTSELALAIAAASTPAHSEEHTREEHHDRAYIGGGASHSHGIGRAHSHAVPGNDGEPVTWRRLLGLGIFGGMIPCPSAIVIMLSAIALHRVGFGLLLILAFSLGLAAVLTAIGFALVYANRASDRVPLLRRIAARVPREGASALFVRAFPVLAAAAVIIAGAVVTLRAVTKTDLL